MKKTKIFAAYLPQYHEIPENNEFWGKGFTDWVGVKNAKPQFEGHNQPRVPLNDNYYDLSKEEPLKWQVSLANKYGVDGFNIYHYWFKDGHKVLEKPAENLLKNKDLNIKYFFSWDNNSWARSWGNIDGNSWAPLYDKKSGKKILLEYDYGSEKDWEEHFNYLLPFFKDDRYYKIDGKPVFCFMRMPEDNTMAKYWNKLAKENGLNGVYCLNGRRMMFNKDILDASFYYEPRIHGFSYREMIDTRLNKYLHIKPKKDLNGAVKYYIDYKKVWERILKDAVRSKNKNIYLGGIVDFDDTPRRGNNARVLAGSSPELFKKYFSILYRICCEYGKDFLLLTAWNEWGEGAYLEPDKENGYAYLKALKEAVDEVNKENK